MSLSARVPDKYSEAARLYEELRALVSDQHIVVWVARQPPPERPSLTSLRSRLPEPEHIVIDPIQTFTTS